MNIKVILLLLLFGLLSCKTTKQDLNKESIKLQLAASYYKALNDSKTSQMRALVGDTIVIRENADNYEERFSQKEYIQWLEWDSVFEPTYTVLEIEQDNQIVKAKISKMDKRLAFLHEKPIVWNEIVKFDNNRTQVNKISRIDRVKYEVFDVEKFIKNREVLVTWIDENYPELKGFLYPQTKPAAIQYLKAIVLYLDEN